MALIYPIGGGKGGVGKSFVTANLGVLLANQGYRVSVVDLDLGGANLHTFFGMSRTGKGIGPFLSQECRSLEEAAEETSVKNLSLIPSMNAPIGVPNLFSAQKQKLIHAILKLPSDIVLLDLGSGTSYNTLDFFLASHTGIFVAVPEPTSIENTFRFINAVYQRKLQHLLKQSAYAAILSDLSNRSRNRVIKAADILEAVSKESPSEGDRLRDELKALQFKFVVNQFRSSVDRSIGLKIEKTCNTHFFSRFEFLGDISYDEKVHTSVVEKIVYVEKYGYTLTALDLMNMSKKLIGAEEKIVRNSTEDCYETV